MFIWQSVLGFLLAVGVLITVHEWGHFWVARRCGVKVLRFSIGFGPALWRWSDKRGTEYVLAAIPLGGYVKMLGDDSEEKVAPEERRFAFNRKSVGARAAIVAAGPLVNLLFAVLAFWLVFMGGVEVARPILGPVGAHSAAAHAGLQAGDEILAINDQPVLSWDEVVLAILKQTGDRGTLELRVRHHLNTETTASRIALLSLPDTLLSKKTDDLLSRLGFEPFDPVPPVIHQVTEGKPAAHAGFRSGDRIVRADGLAIVSRTQFAEYIHKHAGKAVKITVVRDGVKRQLSVVPREEQDAEGRPIGLIGIAFITKPVHLERYVTTERLWPWAAFTKAVSRTAEYSWLTLQMMGKMFTGQVALDNIGGPVTIAKQAGYSMDIGLGYFLQFMAMVSISLGVLNLLPVPLLDGGHLMFYVFECLLRKPVPLKIREWAHRVGGSLLLLLMVFALYNDLMR